MDYKDQIDIASSDHGSKVIYCSDEFFADSGRMLQASDPQWIEGKYCLLYTSPSPRDS